MSEQHVIQHCAPTLAGLKSGSMFSCEIQSTQALLGEVARLNRALHAKGVCIVVLRRSEKCALIYLYRKSHLQNMLADRRARALLSALGYPLHSVEKCVARLAANVRSSADFPHEIGLFLGYPIEDVEGFISKGPRHCKTVGYWKVYGDAAAAGRRFAQLRKCHRAYAALFESGRSLERLTVTC